MRPNYKIRKKPNLKKILNDNKKTKKCIYLKKKHI